MFVLFHGASEGLAEESGEVSLGAKGWPFSGRSRPSRQLCIGNADREVNPESIAENTSVC